MSTSFIRWARIALSVTGWALAVTVVNAACVCASSFPSERGTASNGPHVSDVVPASLLLTPSIDWGRVVSIELENSPAQEFDLDSLRSGGESLPGNDRAENADRWGGEPRVDRTAVVDTGVVRPSGETSQGALSASEPSPSAPNKPRVSHADASEAPAPPAGSGAPKPVRSLQSKRVEQRKNASPRTPVVELGGLVVDETMSPHGRTFYTEFYGVWQSPPVDGFYTVKVQEEPTPGRGTLVQVFVNDDATFQARLQPQTDIAEQALQAARRTYAYVRSGQGLLRIY